MSWVRAGFLLEACTAGNTNISAIRKSLDLMGGLPPEVLLNVQNKIGERLGITAESIRIVKVEKMNWSNACLDLPQAEEACAEVITPGWLLTFSINGQEYRYRTDLAGTVLRREL